MNDINAARLCVSIGIERAEQLADAIKRAAQSADLIELRLDYLSKSEFDSLSDSFLQTLAASSPRPLIFTLRPDEQGGRRDISFDERLRFWRSIFQSRILNQNFADIEFDLLAFIEQHENDLCTSVDWSRVICSHHDFARDGAAGVHEIYERMKKTPARVLKIAVRVDDAIECLPLFQLLERARCDKREMIILGMNEAGIMTRALAPSRGAFLTYAALDSDQKTAPGQLSVAGFEELYRVRSITRATLITGLIGSPVAHSLSPQMHNRAFAEKNLDAVYLPFEAQNLSDFMRRMAHPQTRELDWNLRGLSVTAPHKTSIVEHLDFIEPAARKIGAVNTVVVKGDALHGYNTDHVAALAPLREMIGLRDSRVAVIGAGGAARTLLWSLRQANARVTLFARNTERAARLASGFNVRCESLEGARFNCFDVVINATPCGTRGGETENETVARAAQLEGARVAYDLVYNPSSTVFLREAQRAGCTTLGGLPMLVLQAAAQFKLWTGEDAPVEAMRRAAVEAVDGI